MTWLLNWWGRAVYRLKHGESCHCESNWGPWEMVDFGRMKIRYCQGCGWMETIPFGNPTLRHQRKARR